MGRKRKNPSGREEKENTCVEESDISTATATNTSELHGPMFTIMSNVQRSETFHKRYIKEMKQLYSQMDHGAFLYTFIKMIKVAMEADESNEYAHVTLIFCAKFISSYDGEDTHPLLLDTCKWLLSTISYNPHIRLRLCQFVNMVLNALGQEAALDDAICDRIMEYMLAQLRDVAPSVRVQAILAMQRLQVPDNPDDPVVRAYQFHLCSDPSPKVRQTVITCVGRNYNTIPYVLERLWDIDEKVRRHTYLHMSSYPVRSYKVRQRLMLIEQGLNDRSESVRKVVSSILLQQWLESYDRNLISLTAALKLDANELELDRFRKAGQQMLNEIFKNHARNELVELLPMTEDGEEFQRCVPYEKLNIEVAFYWQCLAGYLQGQMAEEVDKILPELSKFCAYVEKYCETHATKTDPFEIMESQFILLSLLEIARTYDLGDEIGRENLKKFLTNILKNHRLNERVIRVIVKCTESLITNQDARLDYFAEIVQEVCCLNMKQNPLVHDRSLINELLSGSSDKDLDLKLTSLKVKILDLEEQETDCWERKNYNQANKYTEEKNLMIDEYTKLLQPLLDKYTGSETLSLLSKEGRNEIVIKALQIIYYMVVSEKVNTLNPSASKLYNDFICRHIASNNISARDWTLKCGTAYSMLYEANAKEVFAELYIQFFKNHNIRLWETSINCIFDLLDRYGVDKFSMPKTKKPNTGGRQLYNHMDHLDAEDEPSSSAMSNVGQDVDVIYLMSHFLDTCHDVCIIKSIITGFCRLILRGHIKNADILEKLLLRYFNPSTDYEINQTLGVFLETLCAQRKHHLLEPCLMPTVNAVVCATYDSPLRDIKPETIMRFIIDATMPECCPNSEDIHNRLAAAFLNEMLNNVSNKELCKLLSKEIVNLRPNVSRLPTLKAELQQTISKLLESELESRTASYLQSFRDKLEGIHVDLSRQVSATQVANESNDEEDDVVTATSEVTAENDAESTTTATTVTPTPTQSNLDIPPLPPIPPLEHAAVSPPGKRAADNSVVVTPNNTSTTYGRDNNVQHRSLRKSLNVSLTASTGESGPTRPAKIRIEARIDSDKSLSTPSSSKSSKSQSGSEKRDTTPTNGVRKGRNRRVPSSAKKTKDETVTNETPEVIPPSPTAGTPTRSTRQAPSSFVQRSIQRRQMQTAKKTRNLELRMTRLQSKSASEALAKEADEVQPTKSLRISLTNTRLIPRTSALREKNVRHHLTLNDEQETTTTKPISPAIVRKQANKSATTPTRGSTMVTRGGSVTPRRIANDYSIPPVRKKVSNSGTAKRPATPSVDKLRASTNENSTQSQDAPKRPRPSSSPVRRPTRTKTIVSRIPRLTRNSTSSGNDEHVVSEKRSLRLRQDKGTQANNHRNMRPSRLPHKMTRK